MILPLPIDKMLLKNYEEDIKQILNTGSTIYNTRLNRGKVSSVGRALDHRAGGRGSLFPGPDQYSGS